MENAIYANCALCTLHRSFRIPLSSRMFSWLLAILLGFLIAWLYSVRAKSIDGLSYPRKWVPWFGTSLTMMRNRHRLHDMRLEMSKEALEDHPNIKMDLRSVCAFLSMVLEY